MDRRKPWLFPAVGGLLAVATVAFFGHELAGLRTTIAEGRGEIQALRIKLDAERGERAALEARSAELGRRASDLERSLDQARQALLASGEDLGVSLRRLEERTHAFESEVSGIKRQVSGVEAQVRTALARVDEEAAAIGETRRRLNAIAPDDFTTLLSPTVKISSKSDVGSGTVVYSAKHGGRHLTYVLTAYHIVEQNYDPRTPIPLEVMTFKEGRKVREEAGVVVSVNPDLDLALIEIETEKGFDAVAKMISPEKAQNVRLYARVHALGCPLGYAPIPTSGELTSKSKVLDGQSYWMINAPTIFGNSGGGIYLADTGEMIGILSRISAYKNLIDVAVPHMGIVTSMPDIYAWLEREHYQFLFSDRFTYEDCGRARLAARAAGDARTAGITGAVLPAGATAAKKPD